MKKIVGAVGLAWSLLWAGCSQVQPGSDPSKQPESPGKQHEVLTAPRFQPASAARLQVGEDCQVNGSSACLSGVCLHMKPGRNEGYLCSQSCQGSGDCPANWRCAQVYPSPQGRLCVPPAS